MSADHIVKSEMSKLLRVLWQPVRFWTRSARISRKVSALREIARIGTPYDAAPILHFALENDETIAAEAAETIRQLMLKTKRDEWTRLQPSAAFRTDSTVEPGQIARLSRLDPATLVHVLGVASMNGNGYVREAALKVLAQLDDSDILPYVLLRAADWVEPIRELARHILRQALRNFRVRDIAKYHPLVDRFERVERCDLSAVREEILQQLRCPAKRDELISCLHDRDMKVRLFCFQVLESETFTGSRFIEQALSDRAVDVRFWALKYLVRTGQVGEYLDRLLIDKSARIRLHVLQGLLDTSWEQIGGVVSRRIMDDVPAVRTLAQFIMRRNGQDPAVQYRERLSSAADVGAGTVAGLGETGQTSDSDVILPFLTDARSRVRAAAIAALHRLCPRESVDCVVGGLADPSGRVRKTCVRLLIGNRDPGLPPRVRAICEQGNDMAREAALDFLAWRGGFEALSDILQGMLDEDEAVKCSAQKHLSSWNAHYLVSPWSLESSRDWIPKIRELVRRHKEKGTRQDWQELERVISNIEKQR